MSNTLVLYRVLDWPEPGNLYVREAPVTYKRGSTDLEALNVWLVEQGREDVKVVAVMPIKTGEQTYHGGPRAYMVEDREAEVVQMEERLV